METGVLPPVAHTVGGRTVATTEIPIGGLWDIRGVRVSISQSENEMRGGILTNVGGAGRLNLRYSTRGHINIII